MSMCLFLHTPIYSGVHVHKRYLYTCGCVHASVYVCNTVSVLSSEAFYLFLKTGSLTGLDL